MANYKRQESCHYLKTKLIQNKNVMRGSEKYYESIPAIVAER